MTGGDRLRRACGLVLAGLALLVTASSADAACGVSATPVAADIGSFSPAALKAGAPPYVRTFGGFSCSSSAIVTLLGGNYLRATVASGTVLRLTSATGDVASYTLAADANGANPLVPGTATYYINGTLLNVLGALGPGVMNVPVFIRPQSATRIAPGTYTGSFTVQWDWYFCSLLGIGSLCAGTIDADSKPVTIAVSMKVAANGVTVAIAPATTWNPVEFAGNPKAIPGGKLRLTMIVANPDIVPVDADTMVLALPTPPGLTVALDGDGATARPAIQMVQGTPSSTLTLSYVSPANLGDDVDFLTAADATGNFRPIAGDPATQESVTQVRFRPRGTMAALSNFQLSVTYSVR